MEKGIVAGIGEVLWDVLPEGKKIGGAPANFAYHMSQFGFESYVVSAVGNDVLGDEILENFAEKNLKGFIAKVNSPTGTVPVGLDADGIPQYDIKENVAWDNIPLLLNLKCLPGGPEHCVSGPSPRETVSHVILSGELWRQCPRTAIRYLTSICTGISIQRKCFSSLWASATF